MSRTDHEVTPIRYEELAEASPGEIIAVQVRNLDEQIAESTYPRFDSGEISSRSPWYVFSGEVVATDRWEPDFDPEGPSIDDREQTDDVSLASISVDPRVLWTITAEGVTDTSGNVTDVPPIKSDPNAPPDGPQPCLLSYQEDHLTRLIVYEARVEGGDLYHSHRSLGVVVQAASGPLLTPDTVLPEGFEPPTGTRY